MTCTICRETIRSVPLLRSTSALTADSVARHLCAKYQVGEGPIDPEKAKRLQETIRKGLVAFVGLARGRRRLAARLASFS